MLKIYDSLTKRKQELAVSADQEVKIYSCGVTVYDDCHIGHGRSLYTFDYIVKYLRFRGYKVRFIRNITDIDDKIINKTQEFAQKQSLSIEEAWKILIDKYISSYYQDMQSLGLDKADFEPRATEHIKDIIEFIKKLIDKGFAYEKQGSVYFSLRKFKKYGRLSHKNIDDLKNSVRIDNDPLKLDPLDFALWKAGKENEVVWPSPWGQGRPGWHIECSVMSTCYLGNTLTIHGGGKDLIFPHHENEIAQSEALTGETFAKFWMHHGLISIDSQKMSKSLKNFITIKEFLKKYPVDTLKIFYLTGTWRSILDFSQKKIEESDKIREKFYAFWQKLFPLEVKEVAHKDLLEIKSEFIKVMDDDFNAPKVLSIIFDLLKKANESSPDEGYLSQIKTIAVDIFKIFSLFRNISSVDEDLEQFVLGRIKQRKLLREQKLFQEADLIRDELLKKGIIIEDLKNGTSSWRLK